VVVLAPEEVRKALVREVRRMAGVYALRVDHAQHSNAHGDLDEADDLTGSLNQTLSDIFEV